MTEPDPPRDEGSPPADTFALVGHKIRAELIQVLEGSELSLSELRSRIDADVESSQLHYHLQQLVGHFVEQTADGYQLNSVGHRLRWTLRAGDLDRRDEHMTVAADFDCYYCGTPVKATFDRGSAWMECSECEHVYMTDHYELPLSAFEDRTAAFSQFRKYMILRIISLSCGLCASCADSLTTKLHSLEDDRYRKVEIHHLCASCGATWWQTVGMALLADTDLNSFCSAHGIDILSTPHWELEFAATDKHVTVRSTDPWEVALEVTFDDDTLALVVDGDLNVIERNRFDASGVDEIVLPDKTDCLKYLRRHRWPEGVTCPHCNSTDTIKYGTTSKDLQRYRCKACHSRFNDLTGTIFADRNLSLPEMFHIIREMEEPEPAQIARQIDRSSESVLDFMNTVHDARDEEAEVALSAIGNAVEISMSIGDNGKH